jgi:hypothetical protein
MRQRVTSNDQQPCYAVLDISPARAFRFIYRKLHLRVAETDGA